MIITEDLLRSFTRNENINEVRSSRRLFSREQHASVFLSHKHEDKEYVNLVACLLGKLHSTAYIDWLDYSMPKVISGETARQIKQQINQRDKFILVASNAAIESKWCNWELGLGDAYKYDNQKIALFPIRQSTRNWDGNEYMQIYPTIQYFDGTQKGPNTNRIMPKGFYYCPPCDSSFKLKTLKSWLDS